MARAHHGAHDAAHDAVRAVRASRLAMACFMAVPRDCSITFDIVADAECNVNVGAIDVSDVTLEELQIEVEQAGNTWLYNKILKVRMRMRARPSLSCAASVVHKTQRSFPG